MRQEDAIKILETGARSGVLRIAAQGDFRTIKKLLERCLDADIPSMLGPCTVGGWSTKGTLLVEEKDIIRVKELQDVEWREQLEREGFPIVEIDYESSSGGVACPACGTVAPLIDGACSDCGLVLG